MKSNQQVILREAQEIVLINRKSGIESEKHCCQTELVERKGELLMTKKIWSSY